MNPAAATSAVEDAPPPAPTTRLAFFEEHDIGFRVVQWIFGIISCSTVASAGLSAARDELGSDGVAGLLTLLGTSIAGVTLLTIWITIFHCFNFRPKSLPVLSMLLDFILLVIFATGGLFALVDGWLGAGCRGGARYVDSSDAIAGFNCYALRASVVFAILTACLAGSSLANMAKLPSNDSSANVEGNELAAEDQLQYVGVMSTAEEQTKQIVAQDATTRKV